MSKLLPNAIYPFLFLTIYMLYYYAAFPVLSFPDVGWHIAAGDEIRALQSVPKYDSFSFTAEGEEWYNLSWGFDLIISWFHDNLGATSLFYFSIVCAAIACVMVYHNCMVRGVRVESALIVAMLCAFVFFPTLAVRPQLISFILVLWCHNVIHTSRDQHSKLWILPLLAILWANMHGGFIALFLLIACYVVEAYVYKHWSFLKALILASIACMLAILCNPIGWKAYLVAYQGVSSDFQHFIQEWQSFTFFSVESISVYLLLFMLVTNIRHKDIPLADKILTYGWLVMGLNAQRNIIIFAFMSAPYMAIAINSFKQGEDNKLFIDQISDAMFKAKSLLLVGFVIALHYSAVSLGMFSRDNLIEEGGNIAQEVAFIERTYPDLRIFNDYNLGGEIIYRSKGAIKVFIDGRFITVYSHEVVEDYLKMLGVMKSEDTLPHYIDKYDLEGFFINAGGKLDNVLRYDNHWVSVHEGETTRIYIRDDRVVP